MAQPVLLSSGMGSVQHRVAARIGPKSLVEKATATPGIGALKLQRCCDPRTRQLGEVGHLFCEPSPGKCSSALARCDAHIAFSLREATLRFSVSSDEEYVGLHLVQDWRSLDLGERNHNYLLLTLARRRLDDVKHGLPATSCGWTYADILGDEMRMTRNQLNIDVFRIRDRFLSRNVLDGASIFERRRGSGEIRLGVERLSIVKL
jgi:hypothetical protein